MLSIEACYELLVRWAALSCAVGGSAAIALWLTREPARRIRIIQGTFVGLALLPLLMIAPGYPRLAVLPDVGRLDNVEQANDKSVAKLQNETVDSPPHPARLRRAVPLPQGEREILLPSPLVGEGGLRSKPGEGGTAGTASHPGRASAQLSTPSTAAPIATAPPHTAPLPRGEREMSGHAWNYRAVIVAAYLTGLISMLTWTGVGLAAVWRLLRSARPAPLECRILLKSLGGPRTERVALVVSSRVAQPCAVAGWRTTIVLPEALVQQQDPQALRWALAHEWSHVERHDLPWWLASGMLRAIYFYQPLVWWLRGQLQLSQDFLADGAAASLSQSPEDYAEFLTTSSFTRPTLAAGLGIGGRISDLQRRVVMLVDRRRPLERVSPRSWNLATIVAVMLVVGVAAGLAPEEPSLEAGGGRSEEAATDTQATPAPSSVPASTAAPPGGNPQPTPVATPSLEPTPKSEGNPISAPRAKPTPSKQAVPESLVELELRKDPEIAQLLRNAADREVAWQLAANDGTTDQGTVEILKKQLAIVKELIEKKKAELLPNIVQCLAVQNLAARTLSATPVTAQLGAPLPVAPSVPDAKRKIQPGDMVTVYVEGDDGVTSLVFSRFQIEPDGNIALGARYGRLRVADLSPIEAEAALEKHFKHSGVAKGAVKAQVAFDMQLYAPAPQHERIRPGDILDIEVIPRDADIGSALVQPDGSIGIGIRYGRVNVAGQTVDEAARTVKESVAKLFPNAEVQVTYRPPRPLSATIGTPVTPATATPAGPTVAPYLSAIAASPPDTIIPGDVLNIECVPPESKVKSGVTVEPDGRIALGVHYGRVNVGGKSLTEAEQIVQKVVHELVQDPRVQITFQSRGR